MLEEHSLSFQQHEEAFMIEFIREELETLKDLDYCSSPRAQWGAVLGLDPPCAHPPSLVPNLILERVSRSPWKNSKLSDKDAKDSSRYGPENYNNYENAYLPQSVKWCYPVSVCRVMGTYRVWSVMLCSVLWSPGHFDSEHRDPRDLWLLSLEWWLSCFHYVL